LKKEGISFSGLHSKQDRLSNKNIILNKKYSDELEISLNENNRSVDMVVINHNKEISQRRTPLHLRSAMSQHTEKSPKRQKSKTIATALLCEKCEETFQPQEFLEHLKYCQKSNFDHSLPHSQRKNFNGGTTSNYFSRILENNNANSNLNEKYFSVPNNAENNEEYEFYNMNRSLLKSQTALTRGPNNEIVNLLDDLDKEKTEIISQLKNVEEKLQKTQNDNHMIYEEKENLQANLQALLMELEKTKMQMAYSAEEKKQAETLLKKEIKVLIKKLIKTKGKLINQKNVSKLDCTNTSLVNLSGFINFYNQNKENSTFGTKPVETQNNNTDSSFLNQSIQQVFSNSLFSLANKSQNNNRSKSKNATPTNNNNNYERNISKYAQEYREVYYTPNKNEEEMNMMNNSGLENKKGEKEKKFNFQLFKSNTVESTTTKPVKKMNRYNN